MPPRHPQPLGPGWGCSAPNRIGSGLPGAPCVAGGGLSPGCPRALGAHAPLPGGTAISMLHCPSNRFESALALLSSIPSRPELSLAPWGQTTPVQSPVPHVPSYRGHARPCCVHAPSARHRCAAPRGASRARCWAREAAVGEGRRGKWEGGVSPATPPEHPCSNGAALPQPHALQARTCLLLLRVNF